MKVVVERDMESLSREVAQSVTKGILRAIFEHGETDILMVTKTRSFDSLTTTGAA